MEGGNGVEMAITMEDRIRAANHIQRKTMPVLWKTAQKLTDIYSEQAFRWYADLFRQYESMTAEQREIVRKYLEQEAENEGQ